MDRTRAHRPDSQLPVPAADIRPEAQGRAPTLLGGPAGGAVRVWTPRRWWLDWRTPTVFAASQLPAQLLQSYIYHRSFAHCLVLIAFAAAFSYAVWLLLWLISLRRPSYISTDDNGIALTSPRGTRSLRWSEIDLLDDHLNAHHPHLIIRAPEALKILLDGHPRDSGRELMEIIRQKASLERASWGKPRRYVRLKALPRRTGSTDADAEEGHRGHVRLPSAEIDSRAADLPSEEAETLVITGEAWEASIPGSEPASDPGVPAGLVIHHPADDPMYYLYACDSSGFSPCPDSFSSEQTAKEYAQLLFDVNENTWRHLSPPGPGSPPSGEDAKVPDRPH